MNWLIQGSVFFLILWRFIRCFLAHNSGVFIRYSLYLSFLQEEFLDRDVHYFHRLLIDHAKANHLRKIDTMDGDFFLRADKTI